MPLTIFLTTYNRTTTLERTMASYRLLTTPFELVLIDNGSDWQPAVELLDELERWPIVRKVYRLGKVRSMDELTAHFNVALRDQYKPGEWGWFAVTDADVCFDGAVPHTLSAYRELALMHNVSVGPHLRIDAEIPHGYPLRPRLLATETRLLYRRTMNNWRDIPYSAHDIDTTFHMFPAAPEFQRLKMNPVRVGAPYDAMHLDWYVDAFNPTAENDVYIQADTLVGSWGRNWLAGFWQQHRADPDGTLDYLMRQPRNVYDDLCIPSFLISWCHQEGVGTVKDDVEARRWLHAAIPKRFEVFWENQKDWEQMLYADDFSSLNSDGLERAA